VTIKARPVTVNQAALLEPYAVSLILDCPSGPQRLDNFNYPAEQTFKWKPNQCGDVTLEIRFDDFTLTKMYTGPMGFPNFLQDYYDGAQSYQAKDFPDHADDLAGINVDRIRVSYEMNDTSAIRKLLEKDTKTVPHQITHCIGS
jgi:type VI secretion system protein ImpL